MLTQRLPALISALLLLALAGGVYLQIAPVFMAVNNPAMSSQNPAEQISDTNTTNSRQHDIARFDLFGNAQQAPQKAAEEVPAELPATTLKLKLTGILATEEDVLTGALIEGPDRDTDYYKPGDTLPGDAVLKQVHADRVVLDRNGRFENLYFPEEFAAVSFDSAADSIPQEEVYSDSSYTQPSDEPAPEGITTPQVSEAQKNSIKERLNKLRSRIMTERR